MAIRSFANDGTEDVFNGRDTKAARKVCPTEIRKVAVRKLDKLNAAAVLGDMAVPPGNKLEALKGSREGQHSVRINEQYRICFEWRETDAYEVEITDYH